MYSRSVVVVVVVVVENSVAKVYVGKNYQHSFPIKCTLLNLHLQEQAPTVMMQAGHSIDRYVRMRFQHAMGSQHHPIINIHAECRLNSSLSGSTHWVYLYLHRHVWYMHVALRNSSTTLDESM